VSRKWSKDKYNFTVVPRKSARICFSSDWKTDTGFFNAQKKGCEKMNLSIESIIRGRHTNERTQVVGEKMKVHLRDHSGIYILPDGTKLDIDLSKVAPKYPKYQIDESDKTLAYRSDIVSQKSWPLILDSKVWGIRNLTVNRRGLALQQLSDTERLILQLDQPIVSWYLDEDIGHHVQRHWYPDYCPPVLLRVDPSRVMVALVNWRHWNKVCLKAEKR